MRTIVVVEDEQAIAHAIAARLSQEGFTVQTASDGISAVEMCERESPDLVILDLMLPRLDGLEVCRRIQERRAIPVIMLTAKDSETDVLVGLGVGADDYITKPFSTRELVARVHALFRRLDRRAQADGREVLEIGKVVIDPKRRTVASGEDPVHLTATEFDLLHFLAAHSGEVLSRTRLLGDVWGYSDDTGARTVDSHVRSVRAKLGSDIIRTVHGVGYSIGEGQ